LEIDKLKFYVIIFVVVIMYNPCPHFETWTNNNRLAIQLNPHNNKKRRRRGKKRMKRDRGAENL